MDRVVYLHIGHGRCGSSSIQRFGEQNRSALRQQGLDYPHGSEMGFPEELARVGGNAQPIFEARREGSAPLELVADYLDRTSYSRYLLSSEYLINANVPYLKRLTEALEGDGRRVVLVGYVRDQRDWLISRYAQAIKAKRWTKTLETYFSDAHVSSSLDYKPLFDRLCSLTEESEVAVRLYDRARLEGGDVRVDLYGLMGVDVGDLIQDDPTANSSASVDEVEAARLVSAMTDPAEFNPRMFLRYSARRIQEWNAEPSRDLYRLIAPSVMKEVGRYFDRRNEEFRRAYFSDHPSPIFSSAIPNEYDPLAERERVSALSLALVASYLLVRGMEGASRQAHGRWLQAGEAEGNGGD
jgi:hypothetical protein